MALQGDLTSFDAADVLRLLSWTKKSGTLDLSGDRGHGVVRVLHGKVVGGEVEGARTSTDTEVVYELLRFGIGTFVFDEGEPHAEGEPAPVDDVLAGAVTLLNEWKSIESVVPDFARSVRLAPEVAADGVHLSADEWKAIVHLGDGATVRELGDRLGVSDITIGGIVKGLVERELIVLDDVLATGADDGEPDGPGGDATAGGSADGSTEDSGVASAQDSGVASVEEGATPGLPTAALAAPTSPGVIADPPAADPSSWRPAWAQSTGPDLPTVGGAMHADEELSGRRKSRRRFRRD